MTPHIWIAQSAYSFLHSPSHPRDLLTAASEKKIAGICLADLDGAYGLARFYLDAQRLFANEETAPRIFYGAQIRIAMGKITSLIPPAFCDPTSLIAPIFMQPRVVLIAHSHRGYRELCKLLRYSHRAGKASLMIDPSDPDVPWPQSDVTAILPMRGWSALCPPHTERYAQWLADLEQLYTLWKTTSQLPDNFYLALTPPSNPLEHQAMAAHLTAHAQLGIPLLATEDVFFARPDDRPLADLMAAIRLNAPLETVRPWACLPNNAHCIQDPLRLVEFCRRDPRFETALENNFKLATQIDFSFAELKYKYPREFVPVDMTPMDFLRTVTWSKTHSRYGDQIPERVVSLINKELDLIAELDFADYFLTVWDIVNFARSQNILCQGRGSAANSCVCFVLGITAVDPMLSDVLFERFISRERGEPPDIDVDFEHERREEVIQYIYNRYGRERAAMVANVITFRRQGALRAVGKALGIPIDSVDDLLKGTRDRFQRDQPIETIISERQAELGINLDPKLQATWLHLAAQLKGLPRHLGIHSGGFVISQHCLDDLCPTEPATMADRSVIQWCKDDLEQLGLFKIDVLALGMLTALRKTLDALKKHEITIPNQAHIPITLDAIPGDCPVTYDMICAARTMGTFQIESRAQMSIIPRLQPRSFYDLVIQIGIIRPGPIVAGIVTRYVRRRMGQEAAVYPDPRLRPILERTLGVPVFQEQVMRIAMTVGDFTPGEADELRRSMGAWKLTGAIAQFEEKLRSGMRRNGINETFATEIYKQIEGFSEYGFPESHAISFAHLAYASAWMKAHFPAYFLFGILNSQPLGFYSVHSLLQEARQTGVRILSPCLVFSEWDHIISDGPPHLATNGAQQPRGIVRLGLRIVHGLPEQSVQNFLVARSQWREQFAPEHKSLTVWSSSELLNSLESFLNMMLVHFDSRSCMNLIMGGLLNIFSKDRRMLLWHLLGKPGQLVSDLQLRPFLDVEATGQWSESYDDLRDDFEVFGTSLKAHPLTYIKKWLWPFEGQCPVDTLVSAQDLASQKTHSIVRVCGIVTIKQSPPTAKGMIFVTLEDETGNINLTLTPQIASRYRQELTSNQAGILCVAGAIQGAMFGHSLRVTHVFAHRRTSQRPDSDSRRRTTKESKGAVAHNETQSSVVQPNAPGLSVGNMRNSLFLFEDPAVRKAEQQ
jgi:error-prone DNA polymerase